MIFVLKGIVADGEKQDIQQMKDFTYKFEVEE